MSDSNRIFKESLPNKETKRLRFQPSKKRMSDSNRIKESLPNKETKRLRFQPSKKWIRLTNLSNHHVLDGFNVQAVLSLVIVLVMCLAGTIQPAQTGASERRRLPGKGENQLWYDISGQQDIDKPIKTQLADLHYYYLGKFKTRNVKGSQNKDQYYFYKKYTEQEITEMEAQKPCIKMIGRLLLCTGEGNCHKIDDNRKYFIRKKIEIYKGTTVAQKEFGNRKQNWLCIKPYGKEIQLREHKGQTDFHHLLEYFQYMFDCPRQPSYVPTYPTAQPAPGGPPPVPEQAPEPEPEQVPEPVQPAPGQPLAPGQPGPPPLAYEICSWEIYKAAIATWKAGVKSGWYSNPNEHGIYEGLY